MTDTPDPRIDIMAKAVWDQKPKHDAEPEWIDLVRDYPKVADFYRQTAERVIEYIEEAGLA